MNTNMETRRALSVGYDDGMYSKTIHVFIRKVVRRSKEGETQEVCSYLLDHNALKS
jgi:hypothetical protein